jgi:peroxiredoxin
LVVPFIVTFSVVALAPVLPAKATPEDRVGVTLKNATLRDLQGKEARLLDYHKGKVLVIAYTAIGCPISDRYAPRLQSLSREYAKKGVNFVGINANPKDSRKLIRREAKELGITFPMLQDKNHELTEQLDAKTSTEVYVIDEDNVIRYRGMIDDQYAIGEKRERPKNRYLEKAIKAAMKKSDPHITRTAAPGCLITRITPKKSKDGSTKKSKLTYASHIARIVQENCVKCHRLGQIGPFPLTSYEKVTGWSAMIHSVVAEGRMPPWNADAEFDGKFTNQRKLSKKEKRRLLTWIENGMPRGNPKKDPPPKKWPKQWRIGKPNAIFTMKESFLVPKDGVVDYQYFEIQTNYPEDKWITAMEARPGAPEVVHHVLAFIVDPKSGRVNRDRLGLEDGYLCATVPGDTPSIFPKGCAKRLPAGAKIVLQVHYTTNGKAQRDRSKVGLIFAREPITREVRTRGIYNFDFTIPAGDANYEVRSEFTSNEDIEILALFPHMHTRGKSWTYLAHTPDGQTDKLLSVKNYDFNWQESYVCREPIPVAKGTRIECVAHFDNSEGNFENPDATKPVQWGEQTWEEMMIGYIDYVPAKTNEAVTLGSRVPDP